MVKVWRISCAVAMALLLGLCTSCAGSQNTVETEKISEITSTETAVQTEDMADGTIAPDLNGNGIPEQVILKEMEDGQGQELEIWENGTCIDCETGYVAHTGWTSVFLCTLDGKDYLLRYHPTMFQGVGTYDYGLSTFTDKGEEVIQKNRVDFDINFGAPVHSGFEPEAIAAFMEELNALLSNSVVLLNTDSDLQGTFDREGRLYDSLWWLDSQEPVFARDQKKSMLENLQDFQAAMTAVQTPAVLEEAEALPVTEPLEMFFYSGAGAWRTSLVLNPDGSFVGDYSDADGDTVEVCQFHGQFGLAGKLTEHSWLLTMEEVVLDTGHEIGEMWDVTENGYTTHYIASEPYGFDSMDWTVLPMGAQFILYDPNATGHAPGTELYGAAAFQAWMHDRREFLSEQDVLGCWGLQSMETGRGFFADSF